MNDTVEQTEQIRMAELAMELADALPAAMLIFDRELQVIALNERVRKLLKADSKEALIGKGIREVSPNLTEERLEVYRQVMRTGHLQVIVDEIDHPTVGKRLWQIQAVKVGDGLAIVAEDVTDKDAYHILAEQNVHLRKLKQELEELKGQTV